MKREALTPLIPRPPRQALVRIPDHLSYEEASTLPCAALTAYNALLDSLRASTFCTVQLSESDRINASTSPVDSKS